MVLPALIGRELRSAARQPFTYYLRVLGAAALVLMCALAVAEGGDDKDWGARMFPRLHATLLGAIWVLVPLLTADCISRERRERTLPLLFLTPLKPRHIVLAKGLAHGLRALTLWLAVLPVLALPLMAGGVSWVEAVLSALLSFSSICLAMAAGLLASASARVWMRSVALAACLGLLFFFGFIVAVGYVASGRGAALPFPSADPASPWAWCGFGLVLTGDAGACWDNLLSPALRSFSAYPFPTPYAYTVFSSRPPPLLLSFGIVGLSCLLAALLLIALAAWTVNRTWREQPPSERIVRLRQRFCSPLVFKSLFQRWMRWELNRNPVGWLEQRTWSARLVSWTWFAVFISIYSSLLANLWLYERGFHVIQIVLAWLLVISVAVGSAGSFRRERETGLLELLLVSPLREWQIIGGRLRGLWVQYLPAIVLLLGVWLYCAGFLAHGRRELPSVLAYGATLLALPVIGLYNSLARPGFASAFLATLFLGVALPTLLARTDQYLGFPLGLSGQPGAPFQADTGRTFLAILIQLGLAWVCARRLHQNLKRRRFALERVTPSLG